MSHIYIWFAILYIISFSSHKAAILSNAVKYITQTFGTAAYKYQNRALESHDWMGIISRWNIWGNLLWKPNFNSKKPNKSNYMSSRKWNPLILGMNYTLYLTAVVCFVYICIQCIYNSISIGERKWGSHIFVKTTLNWLHSFKTKYYFFSKLNIIRIFCHV